MDAFSQKPFERSFLNDKRHHASTKFVVDKHFQRLTPNFRNSVAY